MGQNLDNQPLAPAAAPLLTSSDPGVAVGGGSSYRNAPESLTARFSLSKGGSVMAKTIMVITGAGKFTEICKTLALAAKVGGPKLTIGQIARRGA